MAESKNGYILLQVESKGEAWYVYPKNKQRYYLGRPEDAFTVMRNLGLGITNADLSQIPQDLGIGVYQKNVATDLGTFTVDYLTFDRKKPSLKMMTDTGTNGDCTTNCAVYPLETYVKRRSGYAGSHGTYFCPTEYATCAGQTNYYFYPVFNSFTGVMVNSERIKYTAEPIVLFDTTNISYFYPETRKFKSLTDLKAQLVVDASFKKGSGVLRAAVSNGPALVVNKVNVLDPSLLDTKQATVTSYRGALGWKGDIIYLVVVRGATVIDSAAVMAGLGLDYALNLDGGGTTALYQGNRYLLGPGRNLPNALVITP